SAPITCCRACAAIFSPGSAATRKRAASLSVRRRSRRMRARAACCSSAPPPASREKRPDAAKRVPPPQRARAGAPSARLPESFMQYMLLIVEPQGQRRTRTPEAGRAVYGQMLGYAAECPAAAWAAIEVREVGPCYE